MALSGVKASERKVQTEKDKVASKSKKKKKTKKQGQHIRAFFKSAEMNGDNER